MDDLLQPSLQNYEKIIFRPRPLSPRAQTLVTFFGGIGAAYYFSVVNTGYLKADQKTIRKVHLIWIASALVALIAYFAVATQIEIYPYTDYPEAARYIRYSNRAIAILVNLYIARLQKPLYARYHLLSSSKSDDSPFQDGWKTGLLAVFIISIPFNLLVLGAITLGNAFLGAR